MFTLTAKEQEQLPSTEDVRFYQEHGWFRTPVLFDESEVDAAVDAVRRHHSGDRDAAPPVELDTIDDWQPGSQYPIRLNDYVAQTNEVLRAFTSRPLLAAIGAKLAGTSQIRLWQSTILYKEPKVVGKYGTIGWHTDIAYWRCCSSTNMLTAWVALQDVDVTMGAVTVVDGSHRWPDTQAAVRQVRFGRTFMGVDPDELQSKIDATSMSVDFVPMTLRKGQVSFHHCMILHGSMPNLADRPRIGIAVHMQDSDNRYQRVEEDGVVHSHKNNDACRSLPDGSPDYTDPRICPVLWDNADSSIERVSRLSGVTR